MNGCPFALELISGPAIEPVTLAEMKLHLRAYSSTTADSQIEGLIQGGREFVEEYTGRVMIDQTWRLTLISGNPSYIGGDSVTGYFPVYLAWRNWIIRNQIFIPKSPVLSIVSVSTVASSGEVTEIDPANYSLRDEGSKWPRVVGVNGNSLIAAELRVEFRCGFADQTVSPPTGAEVVPERFKQSIKLWGEAHYDRDRDMMEKLLSVAKSNVEGERTNLPVA